MELIGILIITGITVVTSICFHKYLSSKYPAFLIPVSLLAGAVSSILFQIANYIYIGYLDPFFIIALIVGAIFSSLVALIIGFIFRGPWKSLEEKQKIAQQKGGEGREDLRRP